ncbi:flagellar hook-associated protein FlgK [Enterovibrio norvegicus]|uniref:Flagellar hook-associated protein 1 n=1 Tax=Enterovibrio norvegicus DSM 15893 TaxID=1121869 RepID=A0A1I5TR98_9GAMM|nr:flagellar hook-associated protein FlgK [Enterovibrio norvegicus]SFP85589.1 flagellar hook-associated protein 1 FlgK [Enterovibrio norvegicus DSM 15893]
MGFDLLALGAQGVLTAQRQLNTTGHNISNVNTEGYSRQSVEQRANDTAYWSANQWGQGVHAASVRRNYDKFAANEFSISTSALSHATTRNSQLTMLDDMMSHSAKKIPENMNEFYGAVKGLTDSPSDMGARKVVLEKSRLVAAGLNDMNTILQAQEMDTSVEIDATLTRMNDIGAEIVDVHKALLKSQAVDNDLLDRHQSLINELSEFTQVSVNQRDDGLYNVIIGSGHTLVSGLHSSELKTVPGDPDHQKRRLALVEGKSLKAIDNDDIRGRLGAMFEYRDNTLGQVRDELGRLAAGFSMSLNDMQSQGFDLSGAIGEKIFTDFNDDRISRDRVIKGSNSTADIKVTLENLSALKIGDYHLKYDGSQYTLVDPEKNMVNVTPTGTPPAFEYDGLKIQVDAGLAAGERVIIRPLRQAAGQIGVIMEDPAKIAAQSYVSSKSNVTGQGDVKILTQGAQQEFQVAISPDATQFAVLDMKGNILVAPQAYPPTGSVNVNGTVFELSDGAAPEDVFAISLQPADGENGNLIRMQKLQTQKLMDGGRSSLIDVYEGLNTDIGVQKASFARLEDVSRVEHDAAAGRVAEISGVNLDEEAANMMKFQQAYMASSRIMTAANETFETLLSATR